MYLFKEKKHEHTYFHLFPTCSCVETCEYLSLSIYLAFCRSFCLLAGKQYEGHSAMQSASSVKRYRTPLSSRLQKVPAMSAWSPSAHATWEALRRAARRVYKWNILKHHILLHIVVWCLHGLRMSADSQIVHAERAKGEPLGQMSDVFSLGINR